ncbi:MAG: putative type IX secretion system sortase PorU2 [Bacteroidia bacterium]
MNTYILLRKNTLTVFKGVFMLFLLLTANANLFAQRPFGNEWIHFDQPYWKIKVGQDGVYRLNYNDLKAAGVDVDGQEPNFYQLFYRGQQIPIYVHGESDSTFNNTDFIEFYGRKNDGALDSLLYAKPSDQSHPYYSTYTDTSAYFLIWGYFDEPLRIKDYNFNAAAVATNIIQEQKLTYFNEVYQDGAQIIPKDNFYTSEYTLNEGWQTKDISRGNQRDVVITTENADNTSSTKPVLEFRINSRSDVWNATPDHNLIVSVKSNSGTFREVYNETYDGFKANIASIPLEWSDLGTNITVRVRSNGVGTNADIHTIAYVRVKYPKKLTVTAQVNKVFENTHATADTAITFRFAKPKTFNADNIILLDITNGFRANPSVNFTADTVSYSIKNTGLVTKYFLFDSTSVISGLSLNPVTFNQIDLSEDYNYLLITHKVFANAAQQYKSYKESRSINDSVKFKVLMMDVEDLYDQFSYGVKHPASIQNFNMYVYKKQAVAPKYLLLLGKGYEIRTVRAKAAEDYVPTIGQPAAELLYVAGIDNNFTGYDLTLYPNIAVGRIAARTEEEALIYLNKLKAYDSVPKALWKKEMIHVGGGMELSVQNLSKNYLNGVKKIAEGPYLGARVHSYFAETSDPVNRDKKAVIQAKIESGIGMLTYFGHASGIQLGVEFADPNTLKNTDKYPIMYLNGCNVGNPALPNVAQSDLYLFGKEKGAVSWLSHTNATYTGTLYDQMRKFYTQMATKSYSGSIGDAWKESLKLVTASAELRAASYSWTIQGDPSLSFPHLPLPDYTITGNIQINPFDVIASSPNFSLQIPIGNLGKTDSQQIAVSVKHTLPNGDIVNYTNQKITPPLFADTITFSIINENRNLQGLNKFEIYVDADSTVIEYDETNNIAQFEHYFPGTGVRSLFPLNYAIVATDTPTLVAQSRDLFDTSTAMYFELDTIPTFNSPFRKTSGLIAKKGLVEWKPQLQSTDSTVYYWRVRLNLPNDSGGYWETRSFTYIKGSPEGWSQSHFPQYAGITAESVIVDTASEIFRYMPVYKGFTATMNAFIGSGMGIKPNDDLILNYCVGSSTLLFIEFDRRTLAFVDSSIQCGIPQFHQRFKMTEPAERQRFILEVDSIKNGNYVALISIGKRQEFNEWETEVYEAFDKLGSSMIKNFKRDSVGFVFAGIKQEAKGELIAEDYKYDSIAAANVGDTARISFILEAIGNKSGYITSEPIGMASKWKTAYNSFRTLEDESADKQFLQIIGIDSLGKDTLLADSITTYSYDLSSIDAKLYPLIKLRIFLEDIKYMTPAQLTNWTVLYDGVPEGSLLLDNQYAFENELNQQGDSMHVKLKFQNIHIHPFKEMLVSYEIVDATNQRVSYELDTFPPLQPQNHFYIDKSFATNNLDGQYRLVIKVNPDFAQPEVTLDNNIFNKRFEVVSDITNPLLDVTFDQRHIANGEIVNANVVIDIMAMKENSTGLLNDTSQFNITLIRPGNDTQSVYFNNSNISFAPGTESNNTANITYKPGPLADGRYELMVQLTDESGNSSGTEPYHITFYVVNKAALSNMYVYPNPITSSAKFLFTLTGSQVPAIHGIEIYNLTGQLVALVPINNLHIGNNEIIWDGTNRRGAKLTSGMYFYRLNMDGELPLHLLSQDKQLSEGYGKLLILHE